MTPKKSTEEEVIWQKLQELASLVEQREEIQARITKTENAIRAFIELLEDETDQKIYSARLNLASKPVGLTENIKRVFRGAVGETITPLDMRSRLEEQGFSLSMYKNPLAVIYTTLFRLKDQGLIEIEGDGFKWIAQGPLDEIRRETEGAKKGKPRRTSPPLLPGRWKK